MRTPEELISREDALKQIVSILDLSDRQVEVLKSLKYFMSVDLGGGYVERIEIARHCTDLFDRALGLQDFETLVLWMQELIPDPPVVYIGEESECILPYAPDSDEEEEGERFIDVDLLRVYLGFELFCCIY